ncbi:MAG: HD domain-containing protein [Deltaproteobacteria bacterium]|nr:MAG: HD domain-containing protein [Deltaproteobacteria bacterium]
MNEIYSRLMNESRRIASRYEVPEFYRRFKPALAISRRIFYHNPLLIHCRALISPDFMDDFGHGIQHATKVSVDGGAIVLLEGEKYFTVQAELERAVVLLQLAGLLHDCRRTEDKHAFAGAQVARKLLRDFPLTPVEVTCVAEAIANHEAFSEPQSCGTLTGQLVADALYDADKFRWGPDNFTHTVWYMSNYRQMDVTELVSRFPWGVNGILRIKDTFRTNIGRQYGPEFIDLGVRIGKTIYQYLQRQLDTLPIAEASNVGESGENVHSNE